MGRCQLVRSLRTNSKEICATLSHKFAKSASPLEKKSQMACDLFGNSFCQPSDHRQDAVGDDLQFGVDLGQIARRLENVEVPVERDFVANFRLLVVDPGIGSVRQHFTLEVGLHVLAQRHVFGVAQVGVRLRLAFQLALRGLYDVACFVTQRAFDRDRAVAESLVFEDAADRDGRGTRG